MRWNGISKHDILDQIILIFSSVKPTRPQIQQRHHSTIDRNYKEKQGVLYILLYIYIYLFVLFYGKL